MRAKTTTTTEPDIEDAATAVADDDQWLTRLGLLIQATEGLELTEHDHNVLSWVARHCPKELARDLSDLLSRVRRGAYPDIASLDDPELAAEKISALDGSADT